MSASVILSSDTHTAKFVTHRGTTSRLFSRVTVAVVIAPKASEGTRKTKDKRIKKDKIIFICMRSVRRFC